MYSKTTLTCVITNVAPPVADSIRTMINPIPDCIINPEQATGIAVTQSIMDIGIRGPYLSQIGPITIRNIDANGILAIFAFHISCLDNPKYFRYDWN